MDDIVKQAMAKWPNVPHCYGWLALDARGHWRMRDEAAQQAGLPGDRLNNAALVGFINRNYLHDEHGNWYFQNGPQRVYVNLEATPFIARTDPQQDLVLQTGQALANIERVYLAETGALLFQAGDVVAQLDDRDMESLLDRFTLDGKPASAEALLAWLEGASGTLCLAIGAATHEVERIGSASVARQLGFRQIPEPPTA